MTDLAEMAFALELDEAHRQALYPPKGTKIARMRRLRDIVTESLRRETYRKDHSNGKGKRRIRNQRRS